MGIRPSLLILEKGFSMNKLIEFNVPGGTVLVETQEPADARTTRGGVIAQVTENIGKSFTDSLSVIHAVADATAGAGRGLLHPPEAVEVTFGLTFTAGLDAVIASGNGTANLNIKMVFKPT